MSRYWQVVFNRMNGYTKNREDAKDLTMETFGKAHRNIEKYDDQFPFQAWILKIAQYTFIDEYRKKRLSLCDNWHTDESYEYNLPRAAIEYLTPEHQLIQHQKHELLHQKIEQLQPKYREVLKLRFLEELSYLEIVNKTNQPIGTVKTNIRRGKKALKALMPAEMA